MSRLSTRVITLHIAILATQLRDAALERVYQQLLAEKARREGTAHTQENRP